MYFLLKGRSINIFYICNFYDHNSSRYVHGESCVHECMISASYKDTVDAQNISWVHEPKGPGLHANKGYRRVATSRRTVQSVRHICHTMNICDGNPAENDVRTCTPDSERIKRTP